MHRFVALLAGFLLCSSAEAWNATGHSIIAAIAYERLTPRTRERVDALLREHPDYATIFTQGAPEDPAARARYAFIVAAVWPDTIKGDPRFYDDTHQDAVPTPLLPGFPDMKRHTNWHYYDTPYSPDGAPTVKQPPPSALSELPRLIRELGHASEQQMVYDLPWFEHLAGDVHQPLHAIGRFLQGQKGSDQGGNRVYILPSGNLHMLWDDACGRELSDAYLTKFAAEAVAENPPPNRIEKNPKKWIEESAQIAIADVYTFGNDNGTREHPIRLPAGYTEIARKVSRQRVAAAGYRLAAVLNDRLK